MVSVKYYFFLIACLLLSGCAAMHSDFSCEAVGGEKGCVTMDRVYKGYLKEKCRTKKTEDKTPYKVTTEIVPEGSFVPEYMPPIVQSILVFPWVDVAGHYHACSRHFIVIKPGAWRNKVRSNIEPENIHKGDAS